MEDKSSFIMFIEKVVNCSAQTKSRTKRTRIIIKVADKYMKVDKITVDNINEKLKMQTTNTQTVCGGS